MTFLLRKSVEITFFLSFSEKLSIYTLKIQVFISFLENPVF